MTSPNYGGYFFLKINKSTRYHSLLKSFSEVESGQAQAFQNKIGIKKPFLSAVKTFKYI